MSTNIVEAHAMRESKRAKQLNLFDMEGCSMGNDPRFMAWSFFAIDSKNNKNSVKFETEEIIIEASPSSIGRATQEDKEFLIYLISIMKDELSAGNYPKQKMRVTAYDYLKKTHKPLSGYYYEKFNEMMTRLQGTDIYTNIEMGGEGIDEWFSWLKSVKVHYQKNKNGNKSVNVFEVEICDWLYNGVVGDQTFIGYSNDYFNMSPIVQRLFEVARVDKHHDFFKIPFLKLQELVGSTGTPKTFKLALHNCKEKCLLEEYEIEFFDIRYPKNPMHKRNKVSYQNQMVVFGRRSSRNEIIVFPSLHEIPYWEQKMIPNTHTGKMSTIDGSSRPRRGVNRKK
jgi:hypothetical protein